MFFLWHWEVCLWNNQNTEIWKKMYFCKKECFITRKDQCPRIETISNSFALFQVPRQTCVMITNLEHWQASVWQCTPSVATLMTSCFWTSASPAFSSPPFFLIYWIACASSVILQRVSILNHAIHPLVPLKALISDCSLNTREAY